MSFDTLGEFVAMGGHGLYVWLAFGITAMVVVANVVSLSIARRRYFREARALERRRRGTTGVSGDQNSPRMEGIP